MNFSEALQYLLSLGNEVEAMKLGLRNIRVLLKALGEPQKNYLKVQVAGTNGKGSVCAFLDSICSEAGIKTGLYTSPHLISITERIKLNGEDISGKEFARLGTVVRETSEKLVADGQLEYIPTFFEQMTAIGLLAFVEAKVELAILETGLGGRYDAATAANAEIAAITQIALDHQEYLGDTVEEIAAEKAAIIRPDSIVCVGQQTPEIYEVINERCAEFDIEAYTLRSARFGIDQSALYFNASGFQADKIMLSLEGEHQVENAALAILITLVLRSFFPINNESIYSGLENAKHPGRLEWGETGGVRILFDGAHNKAGAEALAKYLKVFEAETNIVLVYASMKEKDSESIIKALLPFMSDVIFTEPKNTRSKAATEMAAIAKPIFGRDKIFVVADPGQALDSAIMLAGTYEAIRPALVLVTGSLYLVGELKKLLNNQIKDH